MIRKGQPWWEKVPAERRGDAWAWWIQEMKEGPWGGGRVSEGVGGRRFDWIGEGGRSQQDKCSWVLQRSWCWEMMAFCVSFCGRDTQLCTKTPWFFFFFFQAVSNITCCAVGCGRVTELQSKNGRGSDVPTACPGLQNTPTSSLLAPFFASGWLRWKQPQEWWKPCVEDGRVATSLGLWMTSWGRTPTPSLTPAFLTSNCPGVQHVKKINTLFS